MIEIHSKKHFSLPPDQRIQYNFEMHRSLARQILFLTQHPALLKME